MDILLKPLILLATQKMQGAVKTVDRISRDNLVFLCFIKKIVPQSLIINNYNRNIIKLALSSKLCKQAHICLV